MMDGFANLDGHVIGTLRVQSIAGRNPVRWNVVCTRCGSSGIERHSRLMNGGGCRNAGCGREAIRETVEDTPAKFRRRAEAAESARANADAERKAAESARLERELSETHGKLRAAVRERILSGRDDEVFVSPELRAATMSQAEADRFNREQAALFVERTPEYAQYRSRENFATIGRYLDLNSLQIVSAEMLRHAFERLRDCGALHEIEQAIPEPEPDVVIVEPEPKPSEIPTERTDGMQGWDPYTGQPRFYTNREVAVMSSDDFKKTFKLSKDKQIIARRIL